MKKIIITLTVILMCLLLCSCSSGQEATINTSTEKSTTASAETTTPVKSTVEAASDIKPEASGVTSTTSKSTTGKGTSQAKVISSTSSTATATTKAVATTVSSSSTQKATTKPTSTTEKKQTTTQTTTSSEIHCTVTIECSKILSNMDNLKSGHEAFVPQGNGVMLDNYPLTVKNGTTSYEAVKQACRENDITINATTSSYGVYIAGFNNIDEKDCGGGSGWIYFVNGRAPSKSCGKYIVENGDSIVFSYTC